ncbi:MAG: hypothetical protein FJ295_15645 [Planctomycetes bacterium]|nr:hypothetical protein [Planctomycetota bacterium]
MKKRRPKKADSAGQDNRVGEAITVAWMLATVATLMAEVVGLISFAVVAWIGAKELPAGALVLPWVMWVSAIVTGVLNLILGAIASRIRAVPAPTAIAIGSAVIGILPILGLLILIR